METSAKPVALRPPAADELGYLNDLILRSKAVWGYDETFMAACVEELRVDEALLARNHFMVAATDDGPLGIAEVEMDGATAILEKLFVDPDCLRTGAGKRLFDWARETVKTAGAVRMAIDADPGAEGFYKAMGAVRTGLTPSGSIPGRMLPELTLFLS